MPSMHERVAALRTELAGEDFMSLSALGGPTAHVRFIGRFQGEEVVWDAKLIALAAAESRAAQFLDVGVPGTNGIPIRIGLGVACIDRPTVMKTLVMVRNYKRLRTGRHEFGPYGATAAARRHERSGE